MINDHTLSIADNGRGIPIDPHPLDPSKSALEVICTTLHSGGKFNNNNYLVSGGLHGVGLSVVNALSESLTIEIAKNKILWKQEYLRGKPLGPVIKIGKISNRRGTKITFKPDQEIFGSNLSFNQQLLSEMAKSKAYLCKGVEIKWLCKTNLNTTDKYTAYIYKYFNCLIYHINGYILLIYNSRF